MEETDSTISITGIIPGQELGQVPDQNQVIDLALEKN